MVGWGPAPGCRGVGRAAGHRGPSLKPEWGPHTPGAAESHPARWGPDRSDQDTPFRLVLSLPLVTGEGLEPRAPAGVGVSHDGPPVAARLGQCRRLWAVCPPGPPRMPWVGVEGGRRPSAPQKDVVSVRVCTPEGKTLPCLLEISWCFPYFSKPAQKGSKTHADGRRAPSSPQPLPDPRLPGSRSSVARVGPPANTSAQKPVEGCLLLASMRFF